MRIFNTMCKDIKTGMQMILSECSYNSAVWWLERQGFKRYEKFEVVGNEVWLTFSEPTERLFVYDEDRGYLLAN